jgi:anti-sigma factor RsiW
MITTKPSHRIAAAVAAVLVSAGLLAGGAAATTTHTTNLADYGAAITADISSANATSEGVPHMSDNQTGNGHYFERMDGARSE